MRHSYEDYVVGHDFVHDAVRVDAFHEWVCVDEFGAGDLVMGVDAVEDG